MQLRRTWMKGLDDAGLRLGREHMLQALLTERFRLAVTPSIKQLPIYEIAFVSSLWIKWPFSRTAGTPV
jgi:hypothetical protein